MFVVKCLTLDEMKTKYTSISEGNPHLTSRYCLVELDPTQILSWYQRLFKIHWATCYQAITIGPHSRCPFLGVKAPVESRHEHKFISGGNPHLISWYYRVELGSTQILIFVSINTSYTTPTHLITFISLYNRSLCIGMCLV
jgi:hypothetical protein